MKRALYRTYRRGERFIARLRSYPLMARCMQVVYELPQVGLRDLGVHDLEVPPPIEEGGWMPPFRGDKHDDYTPFAAIAKTWQPERALEFGTAHGNLVANLCRVVPDVQVYTVSAPTEEQTGTRISAEFSREEIGYVYRKYGFEKQVVQILCNTLHLNLADHVAERSFDLAVIDACHDTPYVLNDFRKIAPFMRSGGIVLLHDTHPSLERHLVGSYLACMHLRRRGYDTRHVRGTWWGVWVKP